MVIITVNTVLNDGWGMQLLMEANYGKHNRGKKTNLLKWYHNYHDLETKQTS